jgi:hypothetical protein
MSAALNLWRRAIWAATNDMAAAQRMRYAVTMEFGRRLDGPAGHAFLQFVRSNILAEISPREFLYVCRL